MVKRGVLVNMDLVSSPVAPEFSVEKEDGVMLFCDQVTKRREY